MKEMKTMRMMWRRRLGVALAAGLLASAAFAGADDKLMSFWTTGPDCYADGSPVMEGEVYALVWTRDGATFAGLLADGTLVNPADSEIVLAQPNARQKVVGGETVGYCYPTLFQVPRAYFEDHAEGRYELVLLDTRTTGADGVTRPAGLPGCVRGWGEVPAEIARGCGDAGCGDAASASRDGGGAIATTKGVVATSGGVRTKASGLPPGVSVSQPRITAIKIEDGKVKLTVADTSPLLLYTVSSGKTPAADGAVGAVQPVSGAANASATREIIVPMQEGQRFFKVVQNQ